MSYRALSLKFIIMERGETMKYILFLCFLLSALPSFAQSSFTIKFEPLYGVEHTLNRYPEPARYSTRTFFGARILAGTTLLSAELEGTQSNDRRDYPSQNLKTEDQVQRAMLGLRTTIPATSWLGTFARAGVRASKEKTIITNTATDTQETKEPPLQFDPYAGAGIQLALGSALAANAGATWIFINEGKPDVQYTLGLTMKFGQVR